MSKFTPGPWGAFKNGVYAAELEAIHAGKTCEECGHCPTGCGPAVFVAIAPELIDDIKDGLWDDIESPKQADMRLIAAAPDLLEACKAVASGDENFHELIRAAIAKAEGE